MHECSLLAKTMGFTPAEFVFSLEKKINTFSNSYFLISASPRLTSAIGNQLTYLLNKKWTENWLENFLFLEIK